MLPSLIETLALVAGLVGAAPPAGPDAAGLAARDASRSRAYDIHAHRGGRGNTVESLLPTFAWGLINGAKTLEMDNGITKDGVVVVWHDESIVPEKCVDTKPAFANDPVYPYVGKYVANLTWAQLKTLDCGSKRLTDYPQQLTYPGTRISSQKEIFDFVACADPQHKILWNIESKIDAEFSNLTLGVRDFVTKQHTVFEASPYRNQITYQSFDWRTLIGMKALKPSMTTSALIDGNTVFGPGNTTSPWLAGATFNTSSSVPLGVQIVRAAHKIGAEALSPAATLNGTDPALPGYIPFTTKAMVDEAHRLGMIVLPWTVNRLSVVEYLFGIQVDGIITDYTDVLYRWLQSKSVPVPPKYREEIVMSCLAKALKAQ